jgi:hypothetical protein
VRDRPCPWRSCPGDRQTAPTRTPENSAAGTRVSTRLFLNVVAVAFQRFAYSI